MRVSAKAEYACAAMLELAANHGGPAPLRVKAIADAQGIPQRFLVQILLQLKGAGFVVSVRGAAGGYQLARPPHAIRLVDVIQAIDPPESRKTKDEPRSRALAALRGVWKDVQEQEQRALARVSLADLVREMQQVHAPSYQI